MLSSSSSRRQRSRVAEAPNSSKPLNRRPSTLSGATEVTMNNSHVSPSQPRRPKDNAQRAYSMPVTRKSLVRVDSLSRPLPLPPFIHATNLPIGVSRTSSTASNQSSSTRPLPSPPPAGPMLPPLSASVALRSPSSTGRPLPIRWASLRVNTTIVPRESALPSLIDSPITPMPPSPGELKRKRMAKLRRQLGESLPMEVVYPQEHVVRVLSKLREERKSDDLFADSDSSSDDSDSDLDLDLAEDGKTKDVARMIEALGSAPRTPEGEAYQADMLRRFSRKWIREEGGKRYVEHDVQNILQALREL